MPLPNVLLIVIDDLPRQMLETMPFTQANIADLGANYLNGTITTPLCACSRTTLLTGKLTHNHGVWANTGPYGGWRAMAPHEPNMLPVALRNVGYRTGLFGKYQNGWNKFSWDVNHTVPPGWDVFMAIDALDGGDGAYFNYNLVGTIPDEYHGTAEADYSTDVLAAKATEFIANTDESIPFFCYFSPYGAHGKFEPAPRHVGLYTPGPLNPAVNSDNSLRAPWLRNLPTIDEQKILDIYQGQHEIVMSIDEGIEQMFAAIGDRISNTLVLFTGDNGLQRGEQRLMGKNIPYPGSSNITMLGRWDGQITAGTTPLDIVTNADFTRTILDAAETDLPGIAGEGMFVGTRTSGHLLEGMASTDGDAPGWIAWKTRNWLYINYGTGQGEELYKTICDRNAITNVASQYPDKVIELRTKAVAAAQPLPPNFSL